MVNVCVLLVVFCFLAACAASISLVLLSEKTNRVKGVGISGLGFKVQDLNPMKSKQREQKKKTITKSRTIIPKTNSSFKSPDKPIIQQIINAIPILRTLHINPVS